MKPQAGRTFAGIMFRAGILSNRMASRGVDSMDTPLAIDVPHDGARDMALAGRPVLSDSVSVRRLSKKARGIYAPDTGAPMPLLGAIP